MTTETDGSVPALAAPWPARTGVSRTELDPVSFLHRTAAIHPGRIAVVDGDLRRTYAELRERVNRLASALRGRGVAHLDRVAALCPNVAELLELHFGVPASGGALVAVNTRLSAGEVRHILDHSGARIVVVDPELRGLLADAPEGVEIVELGAQYERLL